MTAFPPSQPYPGPAPVLAAAHPPPVFVAVADPAPQGRLTVLLRYLLAVPHLFLLYMLSMAAGVVVFIGWWAALFTGRLPAFAVTFLGGYLRWSSRATAYVFLLTDKYPPFSLEDDAGYPVRTALPPAQPLNRAAVFFRYFLALPVNLLLAIVLVGAGTLMSFAAWLITLVAGRLPASFHDAYVAVLRYHARVLGYWWLLTPAYPGGLYGDAPGTTAWADEPPAAPAYGSPAYGTQRYGSADYGTPAGGSPGYGPPDPYGMPGGYASPAGSASRARYASRAGYASPAGYTSPAGYAPPAGYRPSVAQTAPDGYATQRGYAAPGYAAAGYGAPAGYGVQPGFVPRTWLLPLTSAARRLITTFIVLGVVLFAGYVAGYATIIRAAIGQTNASVTAATAVVRLSAAHVTLSGGLTAFEQATPRCDNNLTCVTKQDGNAGAEFAAFAGQLSAIPVPASAAADKERLLAAATAAAQNFGRLSKATTGAQYEATVSGSGFKKSLDDFDQDYSALVAKLRTY